MCGWKDFCKRAQVIAPPIYKPEVYRQGADNIAKLTRDVDDAVTGAVGSVVGGVMGAGMGAADAAKSHGAGALSDWGKFKDSMKTIGLGAATGAKTGWNERGRLASDVRTTAAMLGNELGVVPDATMASMRQANNARLIDSMRGHGVRVPQKPPVDPATGALLQVQEPGYEDYNRWVGWSNGGKTVGESFLGAAATFGIPATYGAVPIAAVAAKGAQRSYGEAAAEDKAKALETMRVVKERMKGMDPSSERYRKTYEALARIKDVDQREFASIDPPAKPPARPAPAAASQTGQRNSWSLSPNAQNLIGYGLGGALLGGLFGGRGGWWKWGLLGLLLGALGNGGQLQGTWNRLRGAWNRMAG